MATELHAAFYECPGGCGRTVPVGQKCFDCAVAAVYAPAPPKRKPGRPAA